MSVTAYVVPMVIGIRNKEKEKEYSMFSELYPKKYVKQNNTITQKMRCSKIEVIFFRIKSLEIIRGTISVFFVFQTLFLDE